MANTSPKLLEEILREAARRQGPLLLAWSLAGQAKTSADETLSSFPSCCRSHTHHLGARSESGILDGNLLGANLRGPSVRSTLGTLRCPNPKVTACGAHFFLESNEFCFEHPTLVSNLKTVPRDVKAVVVSIGRVLHAA